MCIRDRNYHNSRVFYVSKQNYKEPIFLEEPDIKFLTDEIYAPITCEISSDTIVNIVTNYDKENNYVLTNNI